MSMRMEIGQYQQQKLQQILAPRMIQSMEILQLPIMSLMERIQLELEKNPVLELKEQGSDDGPAVDVDFTGTESLPPDKPSDPDRDELVIDDKSSELDFDRLEAISRDYEDFLNEAGDVDQLPMRCVIASETEHAVDDGGGSLSAFENSFQGLGASVLVFFRLEADFGVIDDGGQDVVEFVSDARGQSAYAAEALGLE